MVTLNPRLLALAYYDGPTEGFVWGIQGDSTHFFKVVAWDESQNRRLYVLGRVDQGSYRELLTMLSGAELPRVGDVWVPRWEFSDVDLEARANGIVDAGRNALATPSAFVLGESLIDAIEIVTPSEAQVERAKMLVQSDWPGNLAEWLALGRQ